MGNNEIPIFKRDTVSIVVNVTNASTGAVIDITGYTFWFTAKTNETDADGSAVIQKTVTTHNDPTNGQTTITLSTSDTDQDVGNYFYDIQMKDGSGNITTLVKGILKVRQDITVSTS